MSKICIINRNFPPSKGATGYHAQQLANYLVGEGFTVSVVTTGAYNDIQNSIRITFIKSLYKGGIKALRLLTSYVEAKQLIKRAIKQDADFYIVMTDPSILNYMASNLMNGHKWILWTMDLFPDAFVANRLVQPSNWMFQKYVEKIRSQPPDLLLTLGPEQYKFLKDNYYPEVPNISWPIGRRHIQPTFGKVPTPDWHDESHIVLGYIGHLGEAHDPAYIIAIARALEGSKHHLVLSCKGSHHTILEKELKGLKHVSFVSTIPEEHLSLIDIQIVSLRPEWTHICVPSKALTAIQYGSAVLFCGSSQSDTWKYIQDSGWHIDSVSKIEAWVSSLSQSSIKQCRSQAPIRDQEILKSLELGWSDLKEYLLKQQ